ncbi:hypothetical protein EDC14_104217 [Hydrogenispora ethanolica]|uniref:Uncharacterized protein n=1 Tax=Hydrogenispora ethanolica TaxID=1082276 RepID=A0A4R1QZA4_HYDET|nr:hypothetical protein [Hydrogenispora ethanolica]TCL58324.1 hypothetical protein EDC14_104217 [Hydrogenispora ethanolica]
MSVGSTILSIENLSQSVAALLGNPAAFSAGYQATLIATYNNIIADVALLSLTAAQRAQIATVLTQARDTIAAATIGAITVQQINTVLELNQLAVLKLNTFAFLG